MSLTDTATSTPLSPLSKADNVIADVLAIESDNAIALIIPTNPALDLERMGIHVNSTFVSLFVRPGLPERGFFIYGLPDEPVNRMLTQSHVTVVEVNPDASFGRLVSMKCL